MPGEPVKTHKFSRGVYAINFLAVHGECLEPDDPGKPSRREIWIQEGLTPKQTLETILHEALHAEIGSDHRQEDMIHRAGKNIARLLWRLGYRRSE